MDQDRRVALNREEAEMVDEALEGYLYDLTGSTAEVDRLRKLGFRLQVKLSKVVPQGYGLPELRDWQLAILQRTFAPEPQPAPAKKPAPKPARRATRTRAGRAGPSKVVASGAAASPVATTVPFPPPKARAAAPDAPAAGIPTGSSPSTAVPGVKLSRNAARARGGLMRAAKAAEAKGDHAAAEQYRLRADRIVASAAPADAHS